MGFIILLIAIILVCAGSDSSNSYHSTGSSDFGGSFNGHSSRGGNSHDTFEEADSFYDRNGNEHIVDYDGYCEDCDDYHDDF